MILKDLKYLSWSKTRESSGTAGSYLKSYSYTNGIKRYFKLSFFDSNNGTFGYESVNEYIASMLLDELGYNHVHYDLTYSMISINNKDYITYVSSSIDFKKPNESKITFEQFYELNKENNEDLLAFCGRYGFLKDIYQMIIIDYLICNRDRHGANIEVLYNSKTKSYRLAPLFDHGLSLLSPCYKDSDIDNYDIKKEVKVNSFIGSSNLEKNLDLVPTIYFPSKDISIDKLIDSIEIDNHKYLEKVRELLKWRWKGLEDIRNKRQA